MMIISCLFLQNLLIRKICFFDDNHIKMAAAKNKVILFFSFKTVFKVQMDRERERGDNISDLKKKASFEINKVPNSIYFK